MFKARNGVLSKRTGLAGCGHIFFRKLENDQFGRALSPFSREPMLDRFQPLQPAELVLQLYRLTDVNHEKTHELLLELGWLDIAAQYKNFERELQLKKAETDCHPKNDTESSGGEMFEIPVPKKIKAHLDEHVIGQEHAKRVLSVAVHNHYKRIKSGGQIDGVEIQKSNILLLGPSGCGKTLLAESMAKLLNVPFASVDATSITESGYSGNDVELTLQRLLQSADNNKTRAETGIVYIDEIDKKACKEHEGRKDICQGMQQCLLKLIEGSKMLVPNTHAKNAANHIVEIDTRNILFIFGGAFYGLKKIIQNRMEQSPDESSRLACIAQQKLNLLQEVRPQDLVKFGMIPELLGRVPVVTALEELSAGELKRVLVEPKDAIIRQYEKLIGLQGVKLQFEDSALDAIVGLAIARETGARGLRGILEQVMLNVMYELPSRPEITKCVITRGVVEAGEAPQLSRKRAYGWRLSCSTQF